MIMPNCDPGVSNSEEYRLFHETNEFLPQYVKTNNPSHIVLYSKFWDSNYKMRKFLETEMDFVEVF